MYDVVASIVTFGNDRADLKKAVDSFLKEGLRSRIYIVDNSPKDDLRSACTCKGVEYIFNNNNLGFGKAHNIAMDRSMNESKYHLVTNPDVFFESGTVEKLFAFMEKNPGIGCVMPKVLYPSGEAQYLCHLLPTPLNLLLRRFTPGIARTLLKQIDFKYEMRFSCYDKIMDVPCISGSFMFIRNDALKKAGKFDPRFFMYLEDVDLSRRINRYFRNVYFPDAFIYHQHAKGSYKKPSLLKYHIISAIKYFNKWGWFFDNERTAINIAAIKSSGAETTKNKGPG